MLDLAVIGGGAAGFFAAINIKRRLPACRIVIYEKSKTVLGKVKISGGGRCNVTHACFDAKLLSSFYPRGSKELYPVFRRFQPADTQQWFEERGVTLKTESDGRMFPLSDDSQTIIDCFLDQCKTLGIPVKTQHAVSSFRKEDCFYLHVNGETVSVANILLACGSSEYFWNLLGNMGHQIVAPVPSLFTFNIDHALIRDLQGLSLSNAGVNLIMPKEVIKKYGLKPGELTQSGALLITHWGLSGPAILKLSSIAARLLQGCNYRFEIEINLCALSFENTLDFLMKFRSGNSKKKLLNTLLFSIPQRLWQRLLNLSFSSIPHNWSDVSNKDLGILAKNLSGFRLPVNGKSTFKEEFVTAGGVDLKEVDFRTMESKRIQGLYFAGEVLNIDAVTGGFNFQAAWSEAWVMAESFRIS